MSMPSLLQLKRALVLQEQIESLEAELRSILSGNRVGNGKQASEGPKSKKRTGMSAEGRARIVAAQKARWAKSKGETAVGSQPAAAKPVKKQRRKMSPEARARIVAAQKKRWAKVREAKK